jgi:hypothetical protein
MSEYRKAFRNIHHYSLHIKVLSTNISANIDISIAIRYDHNAYHNRFIRLDNITFFSQQESKHE